MDGGGGETPLVSVPSACPPPCVLAFNLCWARLKQHDALEPLVDVVWILPQKHRTQQQRSPLHQILQARHAQIKLIVVLGRVVQHGAQGRLLKLRVRLKDGAKVPHSGHGRQRLLVNVPHLCSAFVVFACGVVRCVVRTCA